MEEIILIGGGGHCKSVIDVLEQEGRFKIAGIIDKPELLGNKILNYKVIGSDDDLKKLAKQYKNAIVTVGQTVSSDIRVKLFTLAKEAGFVFPTIISPRAYVSKYANINEGTVVMHDTLINAAALVGKNCIINSKAIIEHDATIEDNCHISTGTIINGTVQVGQGSFIGSSATTKEAIIIKKNSFVKAGSIIK
ncbi:MAG TPA: acetyltransferase [Sulfurospirillum arcachonense]|nr:acetyltransferase [Sulfurospirillum arcachonense]